MKVLIAVFGETHAWIIPLFHVERLRATFPHVAFADARSPQAILDEIPDADAALAWHLGKTALGAARRLRWVQCTGAGIGHLLYPEMLARPIVITNARGVQSIALAEHVVASALALARKLHISIRRQATHTWSQKEQFGGDPPLRTLRGLCLGLVGLGDIGGSIARLASALGMRVWAYRRRVEIQKPASVERVLGPGQLGELLAAADVLVLAAPLTASTRGLIGSTELRRMKRDAILVNVGRGELVKEDELVAELQAGTIAGAALDVFAREPLDPASPLWDLPNAIVTPHTSGFRGDYWDAVVEIFADNLRRFERGEPLINVVDKEAGY